MPAFFRKGEQMIKSENFINIQGWMVTELGLKGNELLVYALIYGFSQDDNCRFTGSLSYIAEWIQGSKQTVINCLKSLVEKGLIEKFEKNINGVKFCEYQSKNLNTVFEHRSKNLTGGGQNFLPNNINNNKIKENIFINKNIKENKNFRKPTIEEIKEYCLSRNNSVKAEAFFDFYESKGWRVGSSPMKDWQAAVRTWEKRTEPKYTNEEGIEW